MRLRLLAIIFLMSAHAAAIAAVHTFTPTADTYVSESSPTTNDGQSIILRTNATDGAKCRGYLKFNVTGIVDPIVSVKLKMDAQDAIADAAVYSVTGSWSEDGLTWENDNLAWGSLLDSAVNIAKYAQQEFDITGSVTSGGTYSFGIKTESLADLDWYSREKTDKPPTLEITTATLDLVGTFGWQWLNTNCDENDFCFGADLDRNGTVNLYDFVLLGQYWLDTTGYYVATYGDDNNSGSFLEPFATVTKAASLMTPGDTCYVRGGTYHQTATITGLTGDPNNLITFKNYNKEKVILDGSKSLTELGATGWTQHSNNIYKTTLSEDIWQLFVDGEMMIMARWPNLPDGMSLWDQTQSLSWAHGNESQSVVNVVETDDVNSGESLIDSALDMTGAMAILNIGSFQTWPRLVTSHTAGSGSFEYNDIPVNGYRDVHHYYYMECKLNLLDAEKEWFYDKNTKELYLWAPGGGVPSGNIRGKTQTYAVDASNCDYVVVDGTDFFASTFRFTSSSNCTVKNCDLQFPNCSQRMLGVEADMNEHAKMYASNNSSPGNTVLNCIFEKTDGMALRMKGKGAVIENNYFHEIDYTCAGLPGLGVTLNLNGGSETVFKRNTIDTASASSAISPSAKAITEYNRITNTGMLQNDGAAIHRMVPEAPDSISRYNWIHDTPKYTIRFDGDPAGERGLVHHNATWNANCMRLKGNWHQIYNNMGFDYRGNKGDINVATDKHTTPNADSTTYNNAAAKITGWPIPGTASNNYSAHVETLSMRDLLRDPDNYDFRPKAGTVLVDGGLAVPGINDGCVGSEPDIGAYEYGDTHYWIAGRKWPHASTPIPPDGAEFVKQDADLMWLEGYEAVSHNVYFGDDPGDLVAYGNQTNNIFTPGTLLAARTYYWRVDAVTPEGTITGDVWTFTTEPIIDQITITAIDDAFVDVNSPDVNFGGSSIVDLSTPSSGYIKKQGYLKFDIPPYAGTVINAKLRLHTVRTNPLQGGANIYGVSDTSWQEETITWNNQPGIDGEFIVSGEVAASSWGEFDVTSYITDYGLYSLGLIRGVSTSNRSVDSKESAFAPELIITYEIIAP